MEKNIFLLGATGSIGSQVLQIAREKQYKIISIAFGNNITKAEEIIKEFLPLYVCAKEEKDALYLQQKYPDIHFGYGDKGLITCATYQNMSAIMINAVVGIAGLQATIAALEKGYKVLLANKESLVVGGELIKKILQEKKGEIIPLDSEHSTIWKCLGNESINDVKKIIITASGGAFKDKTREQLKDVTISDALKHPTWQMGKKITVDCATMVNKGLEVIEAHYLFNLPYEKIETILHPESIVHSFVEYNDNSIICEMSSPNMLVPIQYAIEGGHHYNDSFKTLQIEDLNKLTFKKMDYERYPMLPLAYQVGMQSGIMPAVYNASNEASVDLFIRGKVSFLEIEKIILESVNSFTNIKEPTLEEILQADKSVKEKIYKKYEV